MKSLNFLFFDFIQIIDNYKININHFLLNDIILPIISYSEICGMIIYAIPIIYYINMDDSFYNKEVFDLSENIYLNIKNKNNIEIIKNNFENFSFQEFEKSEIFLIFHLKTYLKLIILNMI